MTIDEAIKHAKDVAREEKYYAQFEENTLRSKCIKCAEEHEQLAEWLEELKCYRNNNDFSEYADRLYKVAYNKAIDDFADKICTYGTYDDWGNVIDVLEIAEKLKRQVE